MISLDRSTHAAAGSSPLIGNTREFLFFAIALDPAQSQA